MTLLSENTTTALALAGPLSLLRNDPGAALRQVFAEGRGPLPLRELARLLARAVALRLRDQAGGFPGRLAPELLSDMRRNLQEGIAALLDLLPDSGPLILAEQEFDRGADRFPDRRAPLLTRPTMARWQIDRAVVADQGPVLVGDQRE